MAYTTTTLAQFSAQISDLMDDSQTKYWTPMDIQLATWEALLVWGAYTSYWRTRGVFNINPTDPNPFYDLSVVLPTLRTRTWTLDRMVKEIQYMLLEAPNGISGVGMTKQTDVSEILSAIQVGRNRFVMDSHLPLSVHPAFANPPSPDGLVTFVQNCVYVHRASWGDLSSGIWGNLWRQDAWAADKSNPTWTYDSATPQSYSESENSPLQLQLVPPPINAGVVEAITVDSLKMDLTDPSATFGVPDEWVHAIKYSALSYFLSGEGQIKDMVRADYAESRYKQAIRLAKDARSIIRLMCNGKPLPLDSMYSIDSGSPYWRNQSGYPQSAGALYDMVAFNPGIPDQTYGISADVVSSAVLPNSNDYIQLGSEELDHLADYVSHILTFKCGGKDFTGTFSAYDSFMGAVAHRNSINAAKIQYLTPLLGQPQKEWAQRPDLIEAKSA